MRKQTPIRLTMLSIVIIILSIQTSWAYPAIHLPQVGNGIDTALAEQYVRKADTIQSDSAAFYYKKALDTYVAINNQSVQDTLWKRYFEVANLWCDALEDKEDALKAYPMFRKEAIAHFGEKSLTVGHIYRQEGRTWRRMRKAAEAVRCFKKATEIYEAIEAKKDYVRTLITIADTYTNIPDYEAAVPFYRLAQKKCIALFGLMHEETSNCYHELGYNLFRQGKYELALNTLDTLLKIEDEVFSLYDPQRGPSYILMGNVHFKQATYDDAIHYYKKANAVYVQDSLNNLRQIGSCLGNIGACLIEKGDFEQANTLFIQAAELKKATVGENSISLAYTYYNIGSGFASQADFQAALDYFFKSVRIIRKRRGENHPDVAYVYNAIGNVYSKTGEWEKANQYFQDALAIREKTRTTNHPETAKDYDRIGGVYQQNGAYEEAKKAYEKALTIREKTLNPAHHAFGESYVNLAAIATINNDLDEAERLLNKSRAIQEKTLQPYHLSIINNFLMLANVAKKRGDLDTALAHYQTALVRIVPDFEGTRLADNPSVAIGFPYKERLTDILYRKGITLKQKYLQQTDVIEPLELAFKTLSIASEVADMNRLEYQSTFSKKAFLDNAFLVYKNLVDIGAILAEQNHPLVSKAALFSLIEKSKSILLLESLKDESDKVYAGVPKESLADEQQLKKQLAFFENQLLRKKESGAPPTDNRLMELEEKVFQLRQKYQDFIANLEQNYPKYHQLKYDSRLAEIAHIQHQLPNESTALLQYALTKKDLHLMVLTAGQSVQFRQPIDSLFYQQLANVKQFLNTNPGGQTKKQQAEGRQQFIADAYTLYQQLVASALQQFPNLKELIIIPDGDLNYLPFEALLTQLPTPPYDAFDQLDYVINQYAVHYEFSATLWLQNRQTELANNVSFAGFAPVYQGKELLATRSPMALGLSERTTQFEQLKYNQEEVSQLADAFHGKRILGKDATESTFKKQAGNYGVLHLAMHAFVNDKNPNYSYLVFSESPDSIEDRYLYAYELYNMELEADMAVLSACETGSGQLQQGEGVMSLSRAFKYAGVPNIVMSFWKADDFYTKNIMTQFYNFLKLGNQKNKALQQAKQAQIAAAKDNKEAAHPYYWANFVLVGDAQPVSFGNASWMKWLGGGVLLLVGILLNFYYWKKKTQQQQVTSDT